MACADYNVEAVLAKKEDKFLYCPNVEEKEETFLCASNVEAKEETFLCITTSEKKEEPFLYHRSVSSEDRGETVPYSGSDSRVVCP